MSVKYPIVAITGSSGAGTTSVREAFQEIFLREAMNAVFVQGNSFRRYDRVEMKCWVEQNAREGRIMSRFGPEANLLDRLEGLFTEYSRTGTGLIRHYVESPAMAARHQHPEGTFTSWEEILPGTDLLFYEGMHGGYTSDLWTHRTMGPPHNPLVVKLRRHVQQERSDYGVDVARWVDLLIGVVPSVNLEWIQKIHRDVSLTGASAEAATEAILRRLPDYVHYITPQFSYTDINFQRIPLVDTSNPFTARDVPTADESALVIRLREPRRFDFPNLRKRLDGSFMSRANTLVLPNGSIRHALEVICAPLVHELVERRRKAGA